MAKLIVYADWDDKARVWVATSDDVLGLAIEAPTLDRLAERLRVVVPELLEANGQIPPHGDDVEDIEVPFSLIAHQHATLHLAG
jgi:hypothetical protein